MLSLTIKSISANKVRFLLTGVAVMLGVAFMAGTLVLTDTIKQSYDNIATNVYKHTDAVVRSAQRHRENKKEDVRGTIDASTLAAGPHRARREGGRAAAGRRGSRRRTRRRAARRQPQPVRPDRAGWQNDARAQPDGDRLRSRARRADEIVIDRASADKGNFVVGEKVHVVEPARLARVPARRRRDVRRRGQTQPARRWSRSPPTRRRRSSARPAGTTPSRSSRSPACRRRSSCEQHRRPRCTTPAPT